MVSLLGIFKVLYFLRCYLFSDVNGFLYLFLEGEKCFIISSEFGYFAIRALFDLFPFYRAPIDDKFTTNYQILKLQF